ncbi:MAG: gamma-glutamylcyclotransferase [Pseudomonadota bacterium]
MNLFVYGTLQSLELMRAVAGGAIGAPFAARLVGYQVLPVAGGVVPLIKSAPGQTAQGVVFTDLTDAQAARLDSYEGAFGYKAEPVEVETANGPTRAQCYMPLPELMAGEGPWSFSVWQSDHERPAVFAVQELFSHDPIPDHDTLRSMWPMMEARAWARHRATAGPATLRHTPRDGDIKVLDRKPPLGHFFRYQRFSVRHSQFRGGQSDLLSREIFEGVDAAILLPYDPVSDRVLLVEQLRFGPVIRNDPNPWMLEPVAGIVDARETPEDAARREALEEAGITLRDLAFSGSFYPSPGASTDYFYTYVGLCDLPMNEAYLGGIAGESEDLRLHPISFLGAMDLLDTGEIATGPLFFLLYWLSRHRDRLRGLT